MKFKRIISLIMCIVMTISVIIVSQTQVSAATSTNWSWPTNIHSIKSDWPTYSSGKYHGGTDFPVALNSPVYSTCDGEVVAVTSLTTSYGKHIKIKAVVNGETVYMRYCHLNSFAVSVGDQVSSGQLIGYSGSTGNSTGPHLHYEVRNANDYYGNASSPNLNPRNYLPGTSYYFEANSYGYVDLGTDFYAYIINTEAWKHLTNENLNVVMNSETGEANQVWFFERQGDGSYKISNCEDNRALDVHNFGTTDGTNVAVCESNDSTAQRWFITGESGAYFFKAACGDLVLDIEGGSLNDGANVQMWTRNDSTAQKFQVWKLNKPGSASVNCSPGTRYTPTSIYWSETSDTKCYDVKIWNGTYWVGDAYEIVWGVNDTGCMINLPPGYYEAYVDSRNNYSSSMSENVIKFTVADNDSPVDVGDNIYASLLLNEPWLSIANVDGNVQLENSEYKMNKRIWNLQKQSDGSYIIENCYDGKVLTADASGISTSKVTIRENLSSDAQKWYIYGRWSGEYYLRPKCSDKVLDVKNGVNSVGAELQLYDLNYSAAQKFAIYIVDPSVLEPEFLSGDTNNDGTVNMKDIVLLQQHLNNWDVELDLDASDVNDDDVVNMKDIVLLQQYLNGWDVELV